MTHSLAKPGLNTRFGRGLVSEDSSTSPCNSAVGGDALRALALRAGKGDERAFAELYCRMAPRMRSFMTSRLKNTSVDVEEVLQESFLKAWRNIEKYDEKFQFSTWIYTIAIRTAKDHQRKDSRAKEAMERLADRQAERVVMPEVSAAEKEEQSTNLWAIAKETLTRDQFSAMWLRYGEELSISDVAKILKKTSVGVRVQLHRARAAMQKVLKASGEVAQ